MVRLTDRPDMILDVYRGLKTTIQQFIAFKCIGLVEMPVLSVYLYDLSFW